MAARVIRGIQLPPRPVTLRLRIEGGWARGVLQLPGGVSVLQYLNTWEAFLRLTRMSIPGRRETVDFFALQRNGISLVIPPAAEVVPPDPRRGRGSVHRIAVMVRGVGILYGVLDLGRGLRVSDFLAAQRGFFVVENCLLSEKGEPTAKKPTPAVLVNANQVIGVEDSP